MSAPPLPPGLPQVPPGRSAVWSGVALLVVIEATAIASLCVGYYYLRVGSRFWPPPGVDAPDLLSPTIGQLLLLATIVPFALAERGVRQGRVRRLRVLLPAAVALALAYAGMKLAEYAKLPYGWDSHAYGSLVWTLTGYSLLHVLVVAFVAAVLWLAAIRDVLAHRARTAVEAMALYGYFVAGSSLVVYAVVYLTPYVL